MVEAAGGVVLVGDCFAEGGTGVAGSIGFLGDTSIGIVGPGGGASFVGHAGEAAFAVGAGVVAECDVCGAGKVDVDEAV